MRRWSLSTSREKRDKQKHGLFSTSERRRPIKSLKSLTSRRNAIICIAIALTFYSTIMMRSQAPISSSPATGISSSIADKDLLFTCPVGPKSIAVNENEATGLIADFYNKTNGERNSKANRTVEELTNTKYDGWGKTFKENKKLFNDWKAEQFSTLQSGDVIYESACGEGFNLAMTLQIMKDAGKIENVSVYGNDYIERSVEVGHYVLEKIAPSGTKIGSLCQGDSSNLHFVPSDSFDLAYTGYIDQITDPYNIFNTDEETNPDGYSARDLCKAKNENGDWAKAKLVDIDQTAQEEWYAKWVSELVRIVKPGKPVIIENVSLPLCDNLNDWGGVSKKWWKLAVSKYNWDIDVDSIITKDRRPGIGDTRYHVSMRKNAKVI